MLDTKYPRLSTYSCPLSITIVSWAVCKQHKRSLTVHALCTQGKVDACGVCNGPALTRDIFGACCNSTLAANGICCAHDECGVCGGNNECVYAGTLHGVIQEDNAFAVTLPPALLGLQTSLRITMASILDLDPSVIVISQFDHDASYPKHNTPFVLNLTILSPRLTTGEIGGRLSTARSPFLSYSPVVTLSRVISFERFGGVCGPASAFLYVWVRVCPRTPLHTELVRGVSTHAGLVPLLLCPYCTELCPYTVKSCACLLLSLSLRERRVRDWGSLPGQRVQRGRLPCRLPRRLLQLRRERECGHPPVHRPRPVQP